MPKVKDHTRPPKRVDNPDYTVWMKERLRTENNSGYPDEDIFPEDFGKKLPEDGGWIIILMEVNVARVIDPQTTNHIKVRHLTCWYALPTMTPASGGVSLYQAIIQTPEGAVHVFPHEYQLFHLEKFLCCTDEDGFYIHFMSETSAFNENALFYIRSRGISKADAQRMLLPTIKDPNYCWFEFDEAYRDIFPSGTGTPYHRGVRGLR